MPKIKAAIKSVRQTEKRTQRNLSEKTRLKTLHKKATQAPDAGFSASVESQFDRAASKGVIHPNKAARKKSRLAKTLHALAALAPAPKEIKRGTRKKATTRKTSARPAGRKRTT